MEKEGSREVTILYGEGGVKGGHVITILYGEVTIIVITYCTEEGVKGCHVVNIPMFQVTYPLICVDQEEDKEEVEEEEEVMMALPPSWDNMVIYCLYWCYCGVTLPLTDRRHSMGYYGGGRRDYGRGGGGYSYYDRR